MSRGVQMTGALVATALAVSGCNDKSFALVSVLSDSGEIPGVTELVVDLENPPRLDTLVYPRRRPSLFKLDEATPVTFSAGFSTSFEGTLLVGVTAVDASGGVLGYGVGQAEIDPGEVTKVQVKVRRGATPPAGRGGGRFGDGGAAPDGGADGGADGRTGADATPDVAPAPRDAAPPVTCDPAAPTACAGGTCFVACGNDGTAVGMCTASAGARKPGETCERNEDCQAGSQCFAWGCGPKTCLRFCKDDGVCGGGRCQTTVPCGQRDTPFRACSQPCDPTGDATKGCAAGLHCFLFDGEVPDCDCRGPARRGGDGTACRDSEECAPGFLCVSMGGAKVCRALCKLDAPSCPAGKTCTKLVMPDYQTWGGCL